MYPSAISQGQIDRNVASQNWSIFNSTHRQIHLNKGSPITYNLSSKRTSDLSSTFYCSCLRSSVALWTWQIAYWHPAAAAAFAMQPVLSFVVLQLSLLPPPAQLSTSQLLLAAPAAFQTPSSPLLVPPCAPRCGKGHTQTPSAPAENGRWGQLWAMWPYSGRGTFDPLKTRSKEDLGKNKYQLSTVTNQESENGWKSR